LELVGEEIIFDIIVSYTKVMDSRKNRYSKQNRSVYI